MSTTIFPQSGDTGGELPFQHLSRLCAEDHVRGVDDMKVSADSGLDVKVASGSALVNGVHVNVGTEVTLTLNDDAVNYIYLELSRDGSNHVNDPASDADNYKVSTSSTVDDDLFPIAKVSTSNGGINQITDLRWTRPNGTVTAIKRTTEQRTDENSFSEDGSLVLPLIGGHVYRLKAALGFQENFHHKLTSGPNPEAWFNAFNEDDENDPAVESAIGLGDATKWSANTDDGVAIYNGYVDMTGGENHGKLAATWKTHASSASLMKGSLIVLEIIE